MYFVLVDFLVCHLQADTAPIGKEPFGILFRLRTSVSETLVDNELLLVVS